MQDLGAFLISAHVLAAEHVSASHDQELLQTCPGTVAVAVLHLKLSILLLFNDVIQLRVHVCQRSIEHLGPLQGGKTC